MFKVMSDIIDLLNNSTSNSELDNSAADGLVPITILKLPIMLWSNALEFCLLYSNYAS